MGSDHLNSQASLERIKNEPWMQQRERDILAIYQRDPLGSYTDRQVKDLLGLSDMNQVRPSITRFVKEGILMEVGTTQCPETHRSVRLVGWADGRQPPPPPPPPEPKPERGVPQTIMNELPTTKDALKDYVRICEKELKQAKARLTRLQMLYDEADRRLKYIVQQERRKVHCAWDPDEPPI